MDHETLFDVSWASEAKTDTSTQVLLSSSGGLTCPLTAVSDMGVEVGTEGGPSMKELLRRHCEQGKDLWSTLWSGTHPTSDPSPEHSS